MGRVAVHPLTKPIRGVPVGGILEIPAHEARALVVLNRACYADVGTPAPVLPPAAELETTALLEPVEEAPRRPRRRRKAAEVTK